MAHFLKNNEISLRYRLQFCELLAEMDPALFKELKIKVTLVQSFNFKYGAL